MHPYASSSSQFQPTKEETRKSKVKNNLKKFVPLPVKLVGLNLYLGNTNCVV